MTRPIRATPGARNPYDPVATRLPRSWKPMTCQVGDAVASRSRGDKGYGRAGPAKRVRDRRLVTHVATVAASLSESGPPSTMGSERVDGPADFGTLHLAWPQNR